METEMMTDGSKEGGSIVGRLTAPIKRSIAGESAFLLIFTNVTKNRTLKVSFGAPIIGSIIPVSLSSKKIFLCQRGGFLCGTDNVSISPFVGGRNLPSHLFGNEGLILQKLKARGNHEGVAFIHVGGSVVKREILPGDSIHVDTGCLAIWDNELSWQVNVISGVSNFFFAKEGVFISCLTNNTKAPLMAYIQTMPFQRLSQNIVKGVVEHNPSK